MLVSSTHFNQQQKKHIPDTYYYIENTYKRQIILTSFYNFSFHLHTKLFTSIQKGTAKLGVKSYFIYRPLCKQIQGGGAFIRSPVWHRHELFKNEGHRKFLPETSLLFQICRKFYCVAMWETRTRNFHWYITNIPS